MEAAAAEQAIRAEMQRGKGIFEAIMSTADNTPVLKCKHLNAHKRCDIGGFANSSCWQTTKSSKRWCRE